MFLVAIVVGYPVLVWALRVRCSGRLPGWVPLRWLVTVYIAALGAQLFAYMFDLNTSAVPPPTMTWIRYYFDPLAGPKTLYGAVLFLPLAMLAVTGRRLGLSYMEGLDAWTPAMCVVLAVSRVGCALQGCCYGVRSNLFGVVFPPQSPVYYEQLGAGLIRPGDATLPVVPTQMLSAAVLFGLALWSALMLRRGARNLFPVVVTLYSLWRFAIEFARADPDRNAFGPLSTSQWIALAVLAGAAALGRARLRPIAAT